ncbi:MAG: hypothetical protein AAB593_00960 [Patescibacteria group bacterium]
MPILKKKPYELSVRYFKALPLNIRIILSNPNAPGNMHYGGTKIIKEVGLNEVARIHLHNVIYGLFTMELPNLEALPLALQEELETTPEKALEITEIIKQFFISPHKAFFDRIYAPTNNEQTTINNTGKRENNNEQPYVEKPRKQNIVNLKEIPKY